MKLEEKKLSSEEIFDGVAIHLFRDEILLPNGNKGVREVLNYTLEFLSNLPEEDDDEYDVFDLDELRQQEEEMRVEIEDGVYVVTGSRVRKIVGSTNFDDYESMQYFQRALIKCGAIKMLKKAGVQEGDTVHIYGVEFDFVN